MKTRILAAVLFVQAVTGMAGTFPSSTSRSPLVVGRVSDRLSIGADYDRIERGIELDIGPDAVLSATSVSVYAGLDALPWLTLFVTAGSVELKSENGINADAGLKVSGGVSAYLWESDVLTPAFMSGRLSLKASAELARFESDTTFGKVSWIEAVAALPIGYEKFDSYPTGSSGLQTSLALYAGPAISYVQGTERTPRGDVDFDGRQLFGLVAGADVYFSPQFSIGASIAVFDELSYRASTRFHF